MLWDATDDLRISDQKPARAGRSDSSRRPDRARRCGQLQDAAQTLVVRAAPEYPPAPRAFGEGIELLPHRFRHAPAHGFLRSLAQRRVTRPAAAEGLQ